MKLRWSFRAANDRGTQAESQGLGCRLGRCFCAVHRGVHRTPAPRHSDQEKASRKRCFFSFIRLRRVILLRSDIVLRTVLFASRVYRRIKYQ